MRIALIPARGGSKRIPRKNVRPFAGRPMIAWAIDAAHQAGVFDHVVVSTDDAEIAAVARANGAELPFTRPAELATDDAGTLPVVQHALQALQDLGWHVQQLCCLYPAVPLLRPEDLRAALELLDDSGDDYVFALQTFERPVQRALRRDAQGRVQPMFPQHLTARTQDLEPAYHDAGQFYWGRSAAWRAGTSPLAGGRGLLLPPERAVDIDTPADWARAEALFARFHPAEASA
jgi:pseudaminic acid cytidylyltransferase